MMKNLVLVALSLMLLPSAMASSFGLTKQMVADLEKQDVHIIANGEDVSVFVPMKDLFADDSTNLIAKPQFLTQLSALVDRYQPKFVGVIGHLPNGQSDDDKDLLATQTRLLMKALSLQAPGRVVMSGVEEMSVNKKLEFWKQFKAQTSIEIKWKVNLKVDYKVLNV